MKYLGIPLGGNLLREDFWEPELNKVAKRLDGWKRAFLSRGGRLILIELVLSAIPIYYFSLFHVPRNVVCLMEIFLSVFTFGRAVIKWKLII